MGSDNIRQVGTFDFTEGIGTSVSGTASSFSCSNQSVSDKGFSKESVVTKRSEHSDSEGCIGGDGGVVSSYSGSSHSFLPRRFSHQESLPISFGGTHQFVYPFTPETGFFDFMGKIRDNSQSEFQFPGRTFSDRFGSSASSRREGSQVSGCDSGSVTTGCHGQLHSSGLSSESRRDPFLFSVSSEQGNSSSVSQSQYFSVSETCSRQSKSSGGCSLPFPCSSEHRMGNSSISVSGDHSSLGSSSYRSFCHQSESQIGDLRFSHSRRESLGSRCYDPILEGNVQLHVPSFSSSSKDLAQDSEGSLQDHSYCSGLVKTVLVPRTTTSVLCEAPLFASKRGSTVSIQRKKTASRSGESPSARLVVVRDSLRKEAFLREQPSVSQDQSDNLQEQFMTPNGLSSVLGVCRSRLIHSLSLYNTLATGRRRSEIHALSISESCLRFASDKSSVTLLTDPSFLAKNQLPDKGSGIITIPALPPTSDNQVLCPVRALLVYLASSAKLRSAGSSRLFIPIKKGISDISAKTISTWICNTVILAYKSASSEVLVKHQVKAHEVRALASSWNIFNSSSMSEIMSAGFWRSDSAFYNHYLRSMPLHCDNLYSLGPLVAAQQVVFPPPSDGDSALR
ncbi:unnamed protein product [Mytilus edulis]|uniref:Uncharacterized protein n=1 Tax=Mytilus edulis TaxID=6550 RepID=A0A8S3VKQ7_MYTED|nr:unnamed protein product [Mytilus edulis]